MFDKYPIISMETRGRILETFEESLESPPDFCIFEHDGKCQGPIVNGHIVQKARQDLFAENGKVLTFDHPPFRTAVELMKQGKLEIPRLLSTGVATTERFTCKRHDTEVFADIEQQEVNINKLDDKLDKLLTLMAYKCVCGYVAKTRKSNMAWEQTLNIHPYDPWTRAVNFHTYHNLKKALDTLVMIEMAMDPRMDINMLHEVTETGSKPIVAANSCYPVTGPVIVGTQEPLTGLWSPKIITAYPTRTRQIVITSYLQQPSTDHPVQVNRLGDNKPEERHFAAMLTSVALIQECESITMSPKAWYAIPGHKRQAISTYYIACTPGVPEEIQQASQPPGEWLNLFGTSPFGP